MTFNIFDSATAQQDFEYLLGYMGQNVTLNGTTPIRAIITNTDLNRSYDDKKITSLSPLPRGGIIEYNGKKFMIISEESGERYYKNKSIMRQLPLNVVFNHDCNFINVDCFIDSPSFGVDNGQIISMAIGNINLHTQDNEQTKLIKLDDRFIKFGQAFKVTGIDRMTKTGILILSCKKDSINTATDDIINDIAGVLSCGFEITNTTPLSIYTGATVQLVYDSHNAPVTFTSSDMSIATVDENGLVTGVSVGTASITVANASYPAIKETIDIEIKEIVMEYSIVIKSTSVTPNEIKYGQTKEYYAEVYYGADLVTDQTVTFDLFADDRISTTDLAYFDSQDGVNCVVHNNKVDDGYVQLRAMLDSDNSVVAWMRIEMESLF